jgi:4-oxalomesaconate tautomerase
VDPSDPTRVVKSALIRTARLIMAGNVMIPAHRTPDLKQNIR